MILPVVLTLGFLTAVVLVYLQVQFAKMGSHRVASAVERAEKLIEKGKLAQAERMLYRSLRINGWDYEAYLAGKKGNKALNIESVVPGVTRIARMLKVVPGSTLEWVLPAMFTLGDIYKKQGKAKKTSRTFEDALNFIGDTGTIFRSPTKAAISPRCTRNRRCSKRTSAISRRRSGCT
ncbi:MAG: hypothetical protein M5R36_24080 [Deltaproteobacteria bacterium]|nr:hypothetical protein [Deltaproteobacteria bacterium]